MPPTLRLPDGGEIRGHAIKLQEELRDAIRGCVPREGDWYQDVICGLATEAQASVLHMLDADSQQDLNRSSWAVRNLLELYIWVPYVLASRENARRFHEDAICDFADLFKTLGKFPGEEVLAELGKKAIDELAEHRQVTTDKDKFLSVSQLARDMGLESQYSLSNKFLSKMVHTTAMSVKLRFDETGIRQILTVATLQSGAQCMETIFPMLTKELLRLHPTKAE